MLLSRVWNSLIQPPATAPLPQTCMHPLRTEISMHFLLMSKHLQILQAMHLLNLLRELNRLQTSLVGETKDYFAILSKVFFKLTSASVFCGSIRNASLKSELAFS